MVPHGKCGKRKSVEHCKFLKILHIYAHLHIFMVVGSQKSMEGARKKKLSN